MRISTDSTPFPVGPSWKDGVWNLSVFSRHAHGMEVCFFDPSEPEKEILRARFSRRDGDLWHIALEGVTPGLLYGLRATGPYRPDEGHYFHPSRLLLDPWGRAVSGDVRWRPQLSAEPPPDSPDDRDNGPFALKSVVAPEESAPFGSSYRRPRIPWEHTVIYETHVRGLTRTRMDIPEELRGTYAGLARPEVTGWLKSLGVTTLQLLPVHMHLDDEFLMKRNLTNYWGYNSLGFFAPHPEYAAAKDPLRVLDEFRSMVRALHNEGIEVILDVVYNHTAEGGEGGPILSFRGLDNSVYYRSLAGHGFIYLDTTGTGNTVNVNDPAVLHMVMDSLRYWVEEMGVDGFRFDLAVSVGRTQTDFRPRAPFFQAILQDPVLSRVKLIAEPWDIGWGGYQMGAFPAQWAELNGQFRDGVRGFWKGDAHSVPELATRLTGSRELFAHNHRGPTASINMITSHDGFTLRDLVSYNEKHNAANLEDNRDGDSHNLSWNSGAEGEATDPAIEPLRRRRARNFLFTVYCSMGVPFIREGDELYQTKNGNNNNYCQDTPANWVDWAQLDGPENRDMAEFVRLMASLRRDIPPLRRREYVDAPENPRNRPDILWLAPDGRPMTPAAWSNPGLRQLAVLLCAGDTRPAEKPGDETDSIALLVFNAEDKDLAFPLPGSEEICWKPLCDTRHETGVPSGNSHEAAPLIIKAGETYPLLRWSAALLVPVPSPENCAQGARVRTSDLFRFPSPPPTDNSPCEKPKSS